MTGETKSVQLIYVFTVLFTDGSTVETYAERMYEKDGAIYLVMNDSKMGVFQTSLIKGIYPKAK